MRTNLSFNAKGLGKGRLDIIDFNNNMIYDFKFGNAFMSSSQFSLYSGAFQNFDIGIIRPYIPLQILK